MHYANTLQMSTERHHAISSKERLHNVFNELLDRQFPVETASHKHLRTASHFADALNVHVNYQLSAIFSIIFLAAAILMRLFFPQAPVSSTFPTYGVMELTISWPIIKKPEHPSWLQSTINYY